MSAKQMVSDFEGHTELQINMSNEMFELLKKFYRTKPKPEQDVYIVGMDKFTHLVMNGFLKIITPIGGTASYVDDISGLGYTWFEQSNMKRNVDFFVIRDSEYTVEYIKIIGKKQYVRFKMRWL